MSKMRPMAKTNPWEERLQSAIYEARSALDVGLRAHAEERVGKPVKALLDDLLKLPVVGGTFGVEMNSDFAPNQCVRLPSSVLTDACDTKGKTVVGRESSFPCLMVVTYSVGHQVELRLNILERYRDDDDDSSSDERFGNGPDLRLRWSVTADKVTEALESMGLAVLNFVAERYARREAEGAGLWPLR